MGDAKCWTQRECTEVAIAKYSMWMEHGALTSGIEMRDM